MNIFGTENMKIEVLPNPDFEAVLDILGKFHSDSRVGDVYAILKTCVDSGWIQ